MDNIENFDSHEEWWFSLYLEELKSAGYLKYYIYHPKPFILSENIPVTYQLQLSAKIKQKEYILLTDHQYQADWIIYWNLNIAGVLYHDKSPLYSSPKEFPFFVQWSEKRNSFFSVVDVKGNYNINDSWRRFSIDQKWVYQKYKIFVQKLILIPRISKGKMIPANALFVKTFVPQRMLVTDKSGKDRKIRFKYILLEEYLRSHGLR
jgi:hypothetical protein